MALLALVAILLGLPPSSQSGTQPTLRVLDRDPLTVRGSGFRPSETVRVTALGSIKHLVQRATADERGTFKASFRLDADRTSNLVIAAVGSRGSRASAAVTRRPSTPPRE